jgi:hypothetical protein
MTQDDCFGRKVARTGAADVMEVFGDAVPRRNPGGKSGVTGDAGPSAGA